MFRLAEWVPDPHDDLAPWTLWSRGRGVVSHETALVVYGIGEFESARVHLTVPPGFTRRDGVLSLYRAHLPVDDVLDRTGFRVTIPVRLLVDVAGSRPDEDWRVRAIEEAIQRAAAP